MQINHLIIKKLKVLTFDINNIKFLLKKILIIFEDYKIQKEKYKQM